MQKVQLTLTDEEAAILKMQAARFGYRLSRYVKYLISDAVVRLPAGEKIVMPVDDGTIPTFKPSKRTERALRQAEKEYREGKTRIIRSFSELDVEA
ncbi:hypothetical protein HY468_00725 [Candidatus Roizmanbacteria bacterium]|nr:hypothetical protein [Candidatus Roizmanbacteria bacterium]